MRRMGITLMYGVVVALLAVAMPVMAHPQKGPHTKPTPRAKATALAGHGTVSVAPTDAEAATAYQLARQAYVSESLGLTSVTVAVAAASSTQAPSDVLAGGKMMQNIALEDVRLVLDVDNISLRDIMGEVVRQAAVYTGTWTVKWRLKTENMGLLDERVNLTAEAPFGAFCQLLTEKIKNMTGTQLFITAFAGARVIMVTDTYY